MKGEQRTMNFGNVLTAMVTPFDHQGSVDLNQTTKLIEYLIDNGSDGLVVAGTTGESPTLTTKEKLLLFEHVVQVVDKRIPVIAGTGDNNTESSIELTKQAENVGVDAILLVAPYYNKPNQRGLYEHFSTIANHTNLPVMLYNIPGRSIINIDVDTVVKLSKIPNIVSIKESSGELDSITEIIERTGNTFSVYSGDDSLTLPIKSVGGDGVVSVASHVIGNEIQEMLSAFDHGDVRTAAKLHRKLLPIMKGMFIAPSPTPVKAALGLKGIDVGEVRLPLINLSEEEKNLLKKIMETV